MSEDASSLEVFRRRCLEAVLTDDEHEVEQLCQSLMDTKGPNSLTSFLTDPHHFPALGQGHDPGLLHALKGLMDTPLPLSPNHIAHSGSILESYSRAYRGLFIHLAAALGRTRIVCKLIHIAARYHLDSNRQLIVTDVNYNTVLCLAVQTYHEETVQAILDLLQEYPSPSTEFILRHCAAKTSRRLAFCPESKLADSMTDIEIAGHGFGYDLFGCISVLYYILRSDWTDLLRFHTNEISYCSTIVDLCPFHFAALLYSQRAMTVKETSILRLLYRYRYSSWDSIRALKIRNRTVINGTAAHFAVSSYQLSNLVLKKKFPEIPHASDLMNRRKGGENRPPMQRIQQGKDLPSIQGIDDEHEPPLKKRKDNEDHPLMRESEEDEDEASWQGGREARQVMITPSFRC